MNARTNKYDARLFSDLDLDRDVDLPRTKHAKPANDVRRRRAGDLDPFTRCYRAHDRKLRAACARYVAREDVDDLVQDVWTVVAQRPAKLTQSDSKTLSWLIGIAKRCSPSYKTARTGVMALDELLAGESGDDLDGRAMHEDVTEMRVELWGKDD